MLFAWLTIWHWFGFGCVMIILEILVTANFFLLWLGIAAWSVALLAWLLPGLSWQSEFLCFAGVTLMAFSAQYKLLRRTKPQTDKPFLNRRAERYIGRTAILATPLTQGRGAIVLDDARWQVIGDDLPVGTKVIVRAVVGNALHVERA